MTNKQANMLNTMAHEKVEENNTEITFFPCQIGKHNTN